MSHCEDPPPLTSGILARSSLEDPLTHDKHKSSQKKREKEKENCVRAYQEKNIYLGRVGGNLWRILVVKLRAIVFGRLFVQNSRHA